MIRPLLVFLLCALAAPAAPKRVLYITHSAGYRHDSIPTSQNVMRELGERSGAFEIVASEDLSLINADTLRDFDVLYFFTSGELDLTDQQKSDLLAFVRDGKGFGGVHSATDTLYTWPEYGELIGAYFNGHPWAQDVAIHVDDQDHPVTGGLGESFQIADEIYQFRNFVRENTHVLLSLDTTSVDLTKDGVNHDDTGFPLAWRREYGAGRVFYTALGHPESTWLDERFQKIMTQAILWLAGGNDAAPE
jgi:type 1 glutamine amidotransferase